MTGMASEDVCSDFNLEKQTEKQFYRRGRGIRDYAVASLA